MRLIGIGVFRHIGPHDQWIADAGDGAGIYKHRQKDWFRQVGKGYNYSKHESGYLNGMSFYGYEDGSGASRYRPFGGDPS